MTDRAAGMSCATGSRAAADSEAAALVSGHTNSCRRLSAAALPLTRLRPAATAPSGLGHCRFFSTSWQCYYSHQAGCAGHRRHIVTSRHHQRLGPTATPHDSADYNVRATLPVKKCYTGCMYCLYTAAAARPCCPCCNLPGRPPTPAHPPATRRPLK